VSETKKIEALTPDAIEVLGQLFVHGPTWDGNLISKSGRDQLVRVGLAARWNGWQWLTEDGVRSSVEWKNVSPSSRWAKKLKES